jgi:hypothetical protein
MKLGRKPTYLAPLWKLRRSAATEHKIPALDKPTVAQYIAEFDRLNWLKPVRYAAVFERTPLTAQQYADDFLAANPGTSTVCIHGQTFSRRW